MTEMILTEKTITREEILALLTQDSYYRKLKEWPLLTSKDIFPINHRIPTIPDCFCFTSHYGGHNGRNMERINFDINSKHPFTTELLTEFKGHLVACGGAIAKAVSESGFVREDIDLFFYDLSIETATELRTEIIEFIIDKFKTRERKIIINNFSIRTPGELEFVVTRNEYVTTIYVYDHYIEQYGDAYDIHNRRVMIHTYQLIHRIYPNISAIIGGFDISAAMVAYDGKEIYATPLGCWSLKNKSIIIDTKRRSTSFEHRLCKYHNYGFSLIFPGLKRDVITKYVEETSRNNMNNLMNVLKNIVDKHDCKIIEEDFVAEKYPGKNITFLQKKEQILPYLNLSDGQNFSRRLYPDEDEGDEYYSATIGTRAYDREYIEDRYINKISDYAHNDMFSRCLPLANAARLRVGNLAAVVSIVNFSINDDIKSKLLFEADNPDLGFIDIEHYKNRVENIRKVPVSNHENEDWRDRKNKALEHQNFLNLSKCFGKLTPEVIKVRDTDEYYVYRDLMIETMNNNIKVCQEKLTGIKWITVNPGRQWTSSINPIVADPRDWYGPHYIPVITGIPEPVESCLRLARLRSIWSSLPDDIFNLILTYIMKDYADQAWQYIT